MIALDTNVLVRFLVEDDAAQSTRAARLVERAIKAGEALFVSHLVMAELVWVLDRAYGLRKPELLPVLKNLLAARHLVFDDATILTGALERWAAGKGDFSDHLVRGLAMARGCDRVATFDGALLKQHGFFAP